MTLAEDTALMQEIEDFTEDKTFVRLTELKRKMGVGGCKIAYLLRQLGFKKWSEGKTSHPVWYKPEEGE